MPLYSFYCKKCEKEFEEIIMHAEWSGIRCKFCGSKVEKLLDAPGRINIKGYNADNGYSCGEKRKG